MNRKTVSVIIYSIFIVTILTWFLGFKNAWDIFNMTHYPVFILVGIICSVVGVSTRKWGSSLFSAITLIVIYFTINK